MLTGRKVYEWPCPLSGSAAYSDDQCEVTALNAFCGKGRLFNALAKYAPAPYDSMNIRWPHYFERHDADGTLLNRYVFGLNAQNKLIYFDLDAPSVLFNDIFYPTFTQKKPKKGAVKIVIWKLRRFMVNRWKHRIVYNEPWYVSFFRSFVSHLSKPKIITH